MSRIRACLILLATMSAWQSASTGWAESRAVWVAVNQVEYAKLLAADGHRIDSKRWNWMFDRAAGLDKYTLDARATRGLTPEQAKHLQRFVQLSYGPWVTWFDTDYMPCAKKSPSEDHARRKHMTACMGYRGYLEALARALETGSNDLEKYNLMLTMLSSLSAHVVTEFSYEEMEIPVLQALKVFLRTASPPDAVRALDRFQTGWLGLFPAAAQEFRRFSEEHPGLTSEQRTEIASKAAKRFLKD